METEFDRSHSPAVDLGLLPLESTQVLSFKERILPLPPSLLSQILNEYALCLIQNFPKTVFSKPNKVSEGVLE